VWPICGQNLQHVAVEAVVANGKEPQNHNKPVVAATFEMAKT
jgi:hypothetical protein